MPPTAPSALPNYLAKGLPKQDDETLRETREYIDELLAAREQRHQEQEPVTEDELPEDAHVLEMNRVALCISNTVPAAMRAARV